MTAFSWMIVSFAMLMAGVCLARGKDAQEAEGRGAG